MIMLFSFNGTTVFAKEKNVVLQQDGLEVILETDKENYKQEDSINGYLKVTNISSETISNVDLEIFVPDGYEIQKSTSSHFKQEKLEPNESIELKVVLLKSASGKETPKKTDGKNTSTETNMYIYVGIAILSGGIICFLVIKNHKARKLFTVILVGTMACSAFHLKSFSIVASEKTETKSIEISKDITYDKQNLKIQGKVSYAFKINKNINMVYTRAEWVHKIAEVYKLPDLDSDSTTSYFNDIDNSQYKNDINKAIAYGIFPKDSENFNPDAPATREFGALTAIYSLGFETSEDISCNDISSIAYPKEIKLAVDFGLFDLQNGNFNPNANLSIEESNRIIDFINEVTNSSNENGNSDKIVYKKNVKQYKDELEVISDDGQTLVLRKNKASKQIKKNDIFVVNDEDAYKAINISETSTTIDIQYINPELEEFIDSMDLEGESELDFSQFQPAEGVEVVDSSEPQAYSIADDIFDIPNTKHELNAKLKTKFGESIDETLEINVNIPSVAYKLDVDFKNGIYVNNAYFKLTKKGDLKYNFASLDAKDLLEDPAIKTINLGEVPIAGLTKLGINLQIDLVYTLSGKIQYNLHLEGTVGAQIYHNQLRNLSHINKTESLKATAEGKLGLYFNLDASVFDKDVIKMGTEIGGKFTGETTFHPEADLICFDVKLNCYAQLKGEFLKYDITWDIWDGFAEPPIQKHMENMETVPECTFSN